MAHFAQLDANSVVIEVIVINNDVVQNLPFPESEPIGVAFCQSLYGADTAWKQTSYNASFRKNYAGIGYAYDATLDAFIPPQPAPECTLDTVTCQWICPPSVVDEPAAALLANIENATLPPEEAP
jgi:hypothetical protein